MNIHTHQNIASAFIRLSLLISALMASNVMAVECTSLQLIATKNTGVTVSNNPCKEEKKSNIAIGSILHVSADSRLWIKSTDAKNGAISQVICQNNSIQTIDVIVANASLPWVKPQGLNSCGEWVSNRLNCKGNDGQQNNFFCASAISKPTVTVLLKPEKSTALVMRSNIPLNHGHKEEEIIEDIRPDVELCKNLYAVTYPIKATWEVSRLGKVQHLILSNKNNQLTSCIESTLKAEKHETSTRNKTYKQNF